MRQTGIAGQGRGKDKADTREETLGKHACGTAEKQRQAETAEREAGAAARSAGADGSHAQRAEVSNLAAISGCSGLQQGGRRCGPAAAQAPQQEFVRAELFPHEEERNNGKAC